MEENLTNNTFDGIMEFEEIAEPTSPEKGKLKIFMFEGALCIKDWTGKTIRLMPDI